MSEHNLTLPVTGEVVASFALGDTVFLNGTVYTSRDMAHIEIKKLLDAGKPLPEELQGNAIFHAGPVALKKDDGWELNVIGPTTSIRMEPYAEMVGKLGVKLIIGKGGMAQDSLQAFKKYQQVYLQAAPGCAAKIAAGVKAIKNVHWLENGMPEAMWVLEVENFGPFIVTMDSHGNSTYDNVKKIARNAIEEIYPTGS